MKNTFAIIGKSLALLVFAWLGIYLSQKGFDNVQKIRQIERTSQSDIAYTLTGEAKIQATIKVAANSKLPVSDYLQKPVVYYRYLKEREERDSDGNTRWVTEVDRSKAIDFYLQDETGIAFVSAELDKQNIKWSVPQKARETRGRYRFTEWHLAPNDKAWVFGWAEKSHGELKIRFDRLGQYTPIISGFDGTHERGSFGFSSVLFIWGGISCLSFAGFFLVWLLKAHRVLFYLSVITLVNVLTLLSYGSRMLQTDVTGAYQRIERQAEAMKKPVSDALAKAEIYKAADWNRFGDLCGSRYHGADMQTRNYVCQVQLGLYKNQLLYQQYISGFPRNLVAFLAGANDMPYIGKISPAAHQKAVAEIQNNTPTKIRKYWGWLVFPVSLLLVFLLSWFGFKTIKVKRLIENIPTSPSSGVTHGLAEIVGHSESIDKKELLSGPVSDRHCFWYHYLVKEKRGSGKNSSWVTIEDRTESVPFFCTDMEGQIIVDPQGAEVITKHKHSKRSGRRRYYEYAIHPGDAVYALGKAQTSVLHPDKLKIADSDELFIVSNYSEDEVMFKKAITGMIILNFAFAFLFGGFIFSAGINGSFTALTYVLAALVAPLYLAVVMVALHYNDLVFLRERCSRGWANIQVSLKKRADLLPQLEKVAKTFMQHETHLQQELAALRTSVNDATRNIDQAERFLENEIEAVNQFRLRAEAYPDIKAQEAMLDMHKKIATLETEIALIRQGYNDAVQHYNERLQTFPDLILARAFAFKPQEYLHFN